MLVFVGLGAMAIGIMVWLKIEWPASIDREAAALWIENTGAWGPAAIIGLMTIAVVASPIPSAPIALAAGAAYGHYAGTLYVAIGSELGALIAFGLARVLGHDVLRRVFGDRVDAGLLGSQAALTATVFASRLLPFVSFDAMSYAAGLSGLHAWRFALATLAGILPASFVLAHFGSVTVDGNFGASEWIAIGLGLAAGLPLLALALGRKRRSRAAGKGASAIEGNGP
ncbi:MAG: hypothetical protein HLUCCO07_11455 [Rhodobacteraceae bacterium HLUCCO07]|nr:MAG: hypothetical protein HLUCCO07_11455 [Rhodobacteraceae bacterium HLUCCO07]